MKKIVLLATAVLFLFATTAMAESIDGKFGITARGGTSYISNSEWTYGAGGDIETDTGWTAGGGIMYGITDNVAVTFDVIYLQADLKGDCPGYGTIVTAGKTIDFAVGAQWRFMPQSLFVPYVEVGVDALWNKVDITNEFQAELYEFGVMYGVEVGRTYGGHLSVGADYFFTPNIALNAEIRGLYSTKGDITTGAKGGVKLGEYNPSNISGFIGIRFFFGGAQEASKPIAKEITP
jgi:outer membrane protein